MHEVLLSLINKLMGKLEAIRFAARLRDRTALVLVQRNETRWTSNLKLLSGVWLLRSFYRQKNKSLS